MGHKRTRSPNKNSRKDTRRSTKLSRTHFNNPPSPSPFTSLSINPNDPIAPNSPQLEKLILENNYLNFILQNLNDQVMILKRLICNHLRLHTLMENLRTTDTPNPS